MIVRVNAADPKWADELVYMMIGACIELFGGCSDDTLEAIELRVYQGCTYPHSDTPDHVNQCLERLGWPI